MCFQLRCIHHPHSHTTAMQALGAVIFAVICELQIPFQKYLRIGCIYHPHNPASATRNTHLQGQPLILVAFITLIDQHLQQKQETQTPSPGTMSCIYHPHSPAFATSVKDLEKTPGCTVAYNTLTAQSLQPRLLATMIFNHVGCIHDSHRPAFATMREAQSGKEHPELHS